MITQNKVVKFLSKKVELISAIWIVLGLSIILIILSLHKESYSYVDQYNNPGHSDKCYYDGNKKELICLKPIKVKQYYKN